MSPGIRKLLVGKLIVFAFFGCVTLASVSGGSIWASDESDPLARIRAIRFQVRVLSETAVKLEQKTRKEEAIQLLDQACRKGWNELQEIPADRFGDERLAGLTRSLAKEIGASAHLLLDLLPESGASSAEPNARPPISRSEIFQAQIVTLDHVRGPVEMRLEWRLGRLDEGGGLEELASWFAECATILEGLDGADGAQAAFRRLSDSLDKTLENRSEELSRLGDRQDISGIVADFCRGRPGEIGKGELKALLHSRFEAIHPDFLKRTRSNGDTELAASATAEQIVFFFDLARVVRQALVAGEGDPIPGWRETFAEYFRELALVVRPLSEESTEANTILKSRSGVNLDQYSSRPIPGENLRLRMLIEEKGKAPSLPPLSELGLETYFLPPGSYTYIMEIDGEGGSLGTIFTAPAGVKKFEVTLPSYLPSDRVFIPTIGYHVDSWVFGNRPLTRRQFARIIYDEKEEEGGRSQPLGRELWEFYKSVIGTEPVGRMQKLEDLEATQQGLSDGEKTVYLNMEQGKKILSLFGSSHVKAGGFTFAPTLQTDLLSRYLLLTASPGGEELNGDGVLILATDPGILRTGEERRYLLFPVSRAVFSN